MRSCWIAQVKSCSRREVSPRRVPAALASKARSRLSTLRCFLARLELYFLEQPGGSLPIALRKQACCPVSPRPGRYKKRGRFPARANCCVIRTAPQLGRRLATEPRALTQPCQLCLSKSEKKPARRRKFSPHLFHRESRDHQECGS